MCCWHSLHVWAKIYASNNEVGTQARPEQLMTHSALRAPTIPSATPAALSPGVSDCYGWNWVKIINTLSSCKWRRDMATEVA